MRSLLSHRPNSKANEARGFGAHRVVNSRNSAEVKNIAGSLDLLIVTVNVPLDWPAMLATLRPKGRLHVVGAVPEPIPVAAFDLIPTQRSVSVRQMALRLPQEKCSISPRATKSCRRPSISRSPASTKRSSIVGGQGPVSGGARYVSADNFSLKARFRVRPWRAVPILRVKMIAKVRSMTRTMTKPRASYDLDADRCWAAVAARDKGSDGQFYYSVATTGVYAGRRARRGSKLARSRVS